MLINIEALTGSAEPGRKNIVLYDRKDVLRVSEGEVNLSFGKVGLTSTACALILGIITNLVLCRGKEE